MRKFIKKLQEMNNGSMELLTERELFELKEFVEHRGYRIVTEANNVTVTKDASEHKINFPLTERDALKIYKILKPHTFTRKAPRKFIRRK